ncbi:MAG: hypothetical protein ACREU3_00445 [Steroidobacteraceae bacterium]
MRRLSFALLLPLFFVFAEQGAMLHKLSHTYYSGRARAAEMSNGSGLIDNSACPACRAFGQIANPVASTTALPVSKPSTYLPVTDPAYHVAIADPLPPRSRGPPPPA